MIEIAPYAPSNWSERAQRVFNLATYAHFKATFDLGVHWPHTPVSAETQARHDWYEAWSDKLYLYFQTLPDSERVYPPPDE